MTYRISVDTGGTFTDVVVADENGRVAIGKALTSQERSFDGVAAALSVAAENLATSVDRLLSSTDVFIYGTTRAINAVASTAGVWLEAEITSFTFDLLYIQ